MWLSATQKRKFTRFVYNFFQLKRVSRMNHIQITISMDRMLYVKCFCKFKTRCDNHAANYYFLIEANLRIKLKLSMASELHQNIIGADNQYPSSPNLKIHSVTQINKEVGKNYLGEETVYIRMMFPNSFDSFHKIKP